MLGWSGRTVRGVACEVRRGNMRARTLWRRSPSVDGTEKCVIADVRPHTLYKLRSVTQDGSLQRRPDGYIRNTRSGHVAGRRGDG